MVKLGDNLAETLVAPRENSDVRYQQLGYFISRCLLGALTLRCIQETPSRSGFEQGKDRGMTKSS
jgi:hypothetical protein